MSYESGIRARLEHKVCQLEAAVEEAERGVAEAIEAQAVVIRSEASKPASYVSRDNLIEAEVKVNLARYWLDGAKQLVAKEQKHQATIKVQEAIERCKRADEQVTDWAETWKQCVRLIERAARSYGRAWTVIKVAVVGSLGRNAELKRVGNGSVLTFAVASERKAKSEKVTTWVSCSLWGSRGESLAQYLTKGTKVAVSGELSTRESTKTGKTYLEVRVDQLELLGGGQREARQERPREERSSAVQQVVETEGQPLDDLDGLPF